MEDTVISGADIRFLCEQVFVFLKISLAYNSKLNSSFSLCLFSSGEGEGNKINEKRGEN